MTCLQLLLVFQSASKKERTTEQNEKFKKVKLDRSVGIKKTTTPIGALKENYGDLKWDGKDRSSQEAGTPLFKILWPLQLV